MPDMIEIMLAPFAACMVLVALFSYLGIHIIAREVIFVDLALAQMAALGSTTAILFRVGHDSPLGYVFALMFTTLGAFIFAMTHVKRERQRVPQEAIIGITFVVASAAAIVVSARTQQGHEAVEEMLVGAILWVTWPTVLKLLAVFLGVGIFHWFLRNRFFTISLEEGFAEQAGWRIQWWDFLFYASFGVAVTAAVPVAGVLLVFTFLVVPAVIAFLFTRNPRTLVAISWGGAAVACALGLIGSYQFDLPTGPLIVCVFGMVLLAAGFVCRACPMPVAADTKEHRVVGEAGPRVPHSSTVPDEELLET
jgi:zinc/manganese transport system permease protein